MKCKKPDCDDNCTSNALAIDELIRLMSTMYSLCTGKQYEDESH